MEKHRAQGLFGWSDWWPEGGGGGGGGDRVLVYRPLLLKQHMQASELICTESVSHALIPVLLVHNLYYSYVVHNLMGITL